MRKGRALWWVGVSALLVFAGAATAQNIAEEIQLCISDFADDERRLIACGAALESGRVVERADLLLHRASIFYDRGEIDMALADLDDAISDGGNTYRAYLIRGALQVARLRFANAVSDYAEAMTLRPMEAEPYLHRGEALLRQGKPEAAIADFDAAIRLEPMSAPAYANRGIAQGERRAFARAVEDLSTAIAHQPSEAHLYALRGATQRRQGKYIQAMEDLESAIVLDGSFDRYVTVGDLLLAGRSDEALARLAKTTDFYELLSLKTNRYYEPLWRDMRAEPYLRGDAIVARSLAAARAAVVAAPDDLNASSDLLQALNMAGQFTETVTVVEHLPTDIARAPSRPAHVAIIDHYTDALRRLGRHNEAKAVLERLTLISLEEHPFLAQETLRYADHLVDQGRFDDALRAVAVAAPFLTESERPIDVGVRVCANAYLGRDADSLAAFAEFPGDDAPTLARLVANFCLKHQEEAANEMKRLVENEDTRTATLIQLQDCIESPLMPALYRDVAAQIRTLRDRADVRAVVERFGVIGSIPAYC